MRLSRVRPVPGVDRGLELVALAQQAAVDGREVGDDPRHPLPERGLVQAGPGGRQRLVRDEAVQGRRDLQSSGLSAVSHDAALRSSGAVGAR
jgi:hypothetical protein